MNQIEELHRRLTLLEGATSLEVGDVAAVRPEAPRRLAVGDARDRGRVRVAPASRALGDLAPPDRALGEVWDRVNVISARVGSLFAALERFVDDHECGNPDGKGPKPCAACTLGAALTDPADKGPLVRRMVETDLDAAASHLADGSRDTDVDPLFGDGSKPTSPAAAKPAKPAKR